MRLLLLVGRVEEKSIRGGFNLNSYVEEPNYIVCILLTTDMYYAGNVKKNCSCTLM